MTTKSEGIIIPGKLKWYAILALALWLAFSGVAAAEQLYANESGWWRDGGTWNASGTPIQAAVDNATAGETICVAAGNYTESVKISTVHLTLEGAGADVVTVTAANSDDHVFNVTDDYVNISGFTVTGATSYPYAGIYLSGADHCNISENAVSGNYFGIVLDTSSDNTLVSNTASNNFGGIRLQDSSNNMLASNNVPNNEYGIVLWHSINNMLASNNVPNNEYGVVLMNSLNNMLASNTANSNCYYGIRLKYSSNNTLASNTANSNNWGIWLLSSSNNIITSNNMSNNYDGIRLDISCDNSVTGNLLQNNTDCGIYLTGGSTGNNITGNSIVANGALQTGGIYQYQFRNSQSDTVTVIDNFWGFGMNNSTIDASIYDDEEEDGWGEVEFYPFATEPAPYAPTPEEPLAFTTTDAVIALQVAAGSRPSDPRWDVNGDGSVTSLDALMILRAATDAMTDAIYP